jgi:hypothetical protein
MDNNTLQLRSVLVSQVLKFYVSISEFPFLRVFGQMAAWNLIEIAHNVYLISLLRWKNSVSFSTNFQANIDFGSKFLCDRWTLWIESSTNLYSYWCMCVATITSHQSPGSEATIPCRKSGIDVQWGNCYNRFVCNLLLYSPNLQNLWTANCHNFISYAQLLAQLNSIVVSISCSY